MNRSESIIELIKSLNKCQSDLKGAIKDTRNEIFKSKYADLAAVWEAIRDPMTKNGLAIVQTTSFAENKVIVLQTTLFHISGEWVSSEYPIIPMIQVKESPAAKAIWIENMNPQALGSCLTYARRYSLMAIIGVSPEDDDANMASGHKGENKEEAQKQPEKSESDQKKKTPENGKSEEKKANLDPAPGCITNKQRQRLWVINKTAGKTEENLKELIAKWGYESTNDIKYADYEAICDEAEVPF